MRVLFLAVMIVVATATDTCPTQLDEEDVRNLNPGACARFNCDIVFCATDTGAIIEYRGTTANSVVSTPVPSISQRLATIWGNSVWVGDAVIDRTGILQTSDATFNFVGKAVTGTVGGIWVRTHEFPLVAGSGDMLGVMQHVYLRGRPSIRGIRLAPGATRAAAEGAQPVVITASTTYVGDGVTLDLVLKNLGASVVSGNTTVLSDVVLQTTQTMNVYAPITGKTNVVRVRHFDGSSNCARFLLRHMTETVHEIVASPACIAVSSIIGLSEFLPGEFPYVRFSNPCPLIPSTLDTLLVLVAYGDSDCTTSGVDINVPLGKCSGDGNAMVTCEDQT